METHIAVALHQTAMDLYDLGKIEKAKGGSEAAYLQNIQMAFLLDFQAAMQIQYVKGASIRQFSYPRSAGWLAYKCSRYIEARQLAQLGLSHTATISVYEKEKLNDLIKAIDKKTENITPVKSRNKVNTVLAIVSAANTKTKILQIRSIDDKTYQNIKVAANRFTQIARLFLGETVEIKLEKNNQGQMMLQDIRRAA